MSKTDFFENAIVNLDLIQKTFLRYLKKFKIINRNNFIYSKNLQKISQLNNTIKKEELKPQK